jgi:hypothetical protein
MTTQPAVVALVGDLHINSTVALSPPVVNLDDGGTYRASSQQRWIWRHWLDFWTEVKERRDAHGARLVIIINGETGDNNHHPTGQLVTRNPADIQRMVAQALEPATSLMREGDRLFITRGTEAHTGLSSALDEATAHDLGAVPSVLKNPGKSNEVRVNSWWRLRAEFSGVRFDVSHHPPGGGGRRPWTRANFPMTLAAMADWENRNDKHPPHLRIYGHVHAPGDSYDAFRTRVIINPSWQLTTAYGHRLGGGILPIGGAYVICDNGRYEVVKRYHDWPIEGYWREPNNVDGRRTTRAA